MMEETLNGETKKLLKIKINVQLEIESLQLEHPNISNFQGCQNLLTLHSYSGSII